MSDPQDEREDQPLLAETLQQHGKEAVDTCSSSPLVQPAPADSAAVLQVGPGNDSFPSPEYQPGDLSRAKLALYGSHFLSTWGQVAVHREHALQCIVQLF